jgi:hypothetical protein
VRKTRTIIVIFPLVITYLLWTSVNASDPESENDIRKVVSSYCEADFTGVKDIRIDLAKFSLGRDSKEKRTDPLFGGRVVYWEGDPLFVVDSYRIVEVNVLDQRATAEVEYRRLARTKGIGDQKRKIVPDYVEHEMVRINLAYEGSRWWILDPPLPRIGINAIVDYYERILSGFGASWLNRRDISKKQKQLYRKLRDDLRILNSFSRGERDVH